MTGGWSLGNELTALGLEIAHNHYRATVSAIPGMKRSKIPPAFSYPRPKPWTPESIEEAAPTRQARRDGRRHATTVADVASVLSRAFPSRG